MNTVENILNNPLSVKTNDLHYIDDAIGKFPYFQALYLLKLKAKKNIHEIHDLEKDINQAAIYCTNRKILLDYLNHEVTPDVLLKKEATITKENLTDAFTLKEQDNLPKEENKTNEFAVDKEQNKQSKNLPFNYWLQQGREIVESENQPESSDNTNEKFKIIEAFLDKNPKITPQKNFKPPTSTTGNAKENLSHLMTETLADIYVEQKKYDKAMKAYQILRLKYPEKSGYFADRIKMVENLKNN